MDNECSAESMRAELIQLLSDLSILEEYQSSYPTHTSANKLLQDWLLQPQDQLQICACIILGNQASSDDRSLQFVQDDKLHQILLPILVVSKNPELLYAAVSFLRNLALPSRNKETLGSVRTLAVLGRLLNPDNLDRIKVAAARAARQLLIGQCANGYRMLQPIFVDERFPSFANSTTDQFLQAWQGATDPGLKTEIARVLTGMLRQLQKLKATHAEEASALWKLMEDTCQGGLAYPFGALILEKSDRALTVEGWLALRILAQFESGAIMVEQLFEETPYRMALVATICNVINSHAPKADPAAMLTMPPVPTSAGLLKKLSEGQSGVDVVNRMNAHAVVASLLEYRVSSLNYPAFAKSCLRFSHADLG